jgi:hypothetical protein
MESLFKSSSKSSILKVKVNLLPTSISETTVIVPLYYFTIFSHMLRPIHIPYLFYFVEEFNYPNILDNFC